MAKKSEWVKTETYYRSPFKVVEQREGVLRWTVYRNLTILQLFDSLAEALAYCDTNP